MEILKVKDWAKSRDQQFKVQVRTVEGDIIKAQRIKDNKSFYVCESVHLTRLGRRDIIVCIETFFDDLVHVDLCGYVEGYMGATSERVRITINEVEAYYHYIAASIRIKHSIIYESK